MRFNFRRNFNFFRKYRTRNKLIYNRIKDEELKDFLSNSDLTIIDVRSRDEFLKMRVKNSVNFNVINIEKEIVNNIKDKDKKIFVYCLNGSRTRIAIDKLNKLGYYNIYIFGNGGINEIKDENLIEY